MKLPHAPTPVERLTRAIGSVASLIAHTIAFAIAFSLGVFGIASWEIVLLVVTTVVSLEAIYLAILIQMTVNRNTESLREVEEDIDEIQEDVEELGEDVDEIQEDIEEINEDIDEIQEDVEEMTEEEKAEAQTTANVATLEQLTMDVKRVLEDLEALKKKQ
ncbi:hemolysin XhlA family protein [Patescibacteria group bacterium]|nr:hemolysin XhlA family protein [Patescibacteria group bacterium]